MTNQLRKLISIAPLKKLIYIAIFLLVAHIVANYLIWNVFELTEWEMRSRILRQFDMDTEINLQTWFVVFLHIVNALLAYSLVKSDRRHKIGWYVVLLFSVAISMDEFMQFHEIALQTTHNTAGLPPVPNIADTAWWFFVPTIITVGILAGFFVYRNLPGAISKRLSIAAFIFLAGSFGVEVITTGVGSMTFLKNGLLNGLEEGLELAGTLYAMSIMVQYRENIYEKLLTKR